MFDCSSPERRIPDLFNGNRTTGVIKSYWHSQLRSSGTLKDAHAAATPNGNRGVTSVANQQEQHVVTTTPPSSASTGGLTNSLRRSSSSNTLASSLSRCSTLSSRRRRLRAAAESAERRRTVDFCERFGSLAKPLFQNYLLPQFETQETCPVLTVVLDLDETLVSNRDVNLSAAIIRPYCLHVLNALRHMKGLEVVLWTASTKETAMPVVEQLSQSGPVFDEVIYRSDLWFTEPLHTKDLRLLGRDMNRILIVDNAANCCKLNPQNAVLADDFHGVRHHDDATLVNIYYIIERVLNACHEKKAVKDTLRKLAADGHLCSSLVLTLPEAWRSLPLREIAPLKIPPHGRFTRANNNPLGRSIMRYWSM